MSIKQGVVEDGLVVNVTRPSDGTTVELVGLSPRQLQALMELLEAETEVQNSIIWGVLEPEGAPPNSTATRVFRDAKARIVQIETLWLVASQMLPGGEFNADQ